MGTKRRSRSIWTSGLFSLISQMNVAHNVSSERGTHTDKFFNVLCIRGRIQTRKESADCLAFPVLILGGISADS